MNKMPPILNTSWETRASAGEPSSTIHVKNLQAAITGPQDAWGRPGRPQPAIVWAEVSMARPFAVSSSQDAVEADTVHYGLLSKKIQKVLDGISQYHHHHQWVPVAALSLASVVGVIWEELTGSSFLRDERTENTATALLKQGSFRYLRITLQLPKASLIGNGVSISASASVNLARNGLSLKLSSRASTLRIHDLRVPTLIGVNDNERQAKQTVVATIEIDKWLGLADGYCAIEALVTKTMEDSSYETLETLLYAIASKITAHLQKIQPEQAETGWRLKISLEKPIAVPFADAPCVELSVDTKDIRADVEA